MENTVYYTFSTVSQTLAAMVALLGVFSIYRLQSLNNKLIDLSQVYLDFLNRLEMENQYQFPIWSMNKELAKLIIAKNYLGILDLTNKEHKKLEGIVPPELSNFKDSINKIVLDKKEVIKKTVFITSSSLIIIICSIIMLSFASKIESLTFWLSFFPFLLAIGYVFWIIFQLIKFSLSSDI